MITSSCLTWLLYELLNQSDRLIQQFMQQPHFRIMAEHTTL